jgi:aryl-alcohol dehydrogenase-like predicted oxidoreductase
MQYNQLGSSDLMVSRVCLGTMTFGQQNTQADASEQLEYAVDHGINFIDTAELYAVPPREATYGATETMIGNWLQAQPQQRSKIVLATKIAGRGVAHIRGGDKILSQYIASSIDASLQRLQTDYIDLYQLHWPNRSNPSFNRHWFNIVDFTTIDPEQEEAEMLAILEALDTCVKAGKIHYCGLSNETSWGIEKYVNLAKQNGLPKMVSLQNEFSLIQTKDWPMVVESCQLNDIAYLPWSPLGTGVLSGKYHNGNRPAGSRWNLSDRHGNFRNQPDVHKAVAAYTELAAAHGMTSSQLSLAWCNHFYWVTSTIIGATQMAQLKENLSAFDLTLSDEVIAGVHEIKRQYYVPYA